jgi:FKBP-type peptidyl-prolyl cis-trans isomerase
VELTGWLKVLKTRRMANTDVKIEHITQGTGPAPKKGHPVTVHYTGFFTNGVKFDSSVDRDEPFVFVLGAGQVIAGWDIGVAAMKVGDKVKLTIPPELAYGREGYPGAIPPNSTLVFEVELLEVG